MVYSPAAGAFGAAGSRGGQSEVSKESDGATHGADEALAQERSVLRLVSRSMPLPELLAEVCCRAERLLGAGANCAILRLDGDGRRLRIGSAPSFVSLALTVSTVCSACSRATAFF
ncbi:hypothetical protein [Paraburkholderia sp. CNPSo 3274]|uniref:hypothetical protein n=1 Tax=Paraburkholderia sp. CNPSo 3274 TaxID=2940932 RepID=UPI00265F573C